MKVKFIYSPEEAAEADADLVILRHRHPGSKVHGGPDRPDQRQMYLKTEGEAVPISPCLFCCFYPPRQGKPCAVCPAEAACNTS